MNELRVAECRVRSPDPIGQFPAVTVRERARCHPVLIYDVKDAAVIEPGPHVFDQLVGEILGRAGGAEILIDIERADPARTVWVVKRSPVGMR